MRYVIVVVALAGIVVSALALGEHYGPAVSRREVLRSNAVWNSAYVNQNEYAEVYGVPVAALEIAGFALLGALAWLRLTTAMVYFAGITFAFSLYLTGIEAELLHVWCAYWVTSLCLFTLIAFLAFATIIWQTETP